MEDTITYILVFGLLIGFTTLYLFRKDKTNVFRLSTRQLANLILILSVEKKAKKILSVLLEIDGNEPVIPSSFFIELIDKQRDREVIMMHQFLSKANSLQENEKGIRFLYNDFKMALQATNFQYETFRFGYLLQDGRKIKTHELKLSSYWNLYKVDSGRYN